MVGRHYCIGVTAAVAIDVRDRLVEVGDDADRQDRREVFGAPVLLTRGDTGDSRLLQQCAGGCVAAQFDTVAAAAEEPDALVATGVAPAGVWR